METKIRTLGTLHAKSYAVDLDEVGRIEGPPSRRLVIRHPSAVVLVPLMDHDRTMVVHQYRYALAAETIEFPAGKLDPGETPEEAAHRELIEETGYRAGRVERLISFAPACGYSTEIIHVFVATDLAPSGRPFQPGEISRVEIIGLEGLERVDHGRQGLRRDHHYGPVGL